MTAVDEKETHFIFNCLLKSLEILRNSRYRVLLVSGEDGKVGGMRY